MSQSASQRTPLSGASSSTLSEAIVRDHAAAGHADDEFGLLGDFDCFAVDGHESVTLIGADQFRFVTNLNITRRSEQKRLGYIFLQDRIFDILKLNHTRDAGYWKPLSAASLSSRLA